MFYNILDKKRIDLLPFLKEFKKDFYLAGGTGLALQIGHRDSVDFDFFTDKKINNNKLFLKIKEVFADYKIKKIEQDEDTLIILINDIKISFFYYPYKLIKKCVNEDSLRIASIEDIGSMKLSAVVGRATTKDYVDLYYILQTVNLNDLLDSAEKKFLDIDRNLMLKSLIYFKDIKQERIRFRNDNYISFEQVKDYIEKQVKKL